MLQRLQTKEHSFQGKSTAEWARLRRLQTDLEAETGNACFLGLSLADTLRQCISLGNHRAASRVRTEFKISDRRFWWIKVILQAQCMHARVHAIGKKVTVIRAVAPCCLRSLVSQKGGLCSMHSRDSFLKAAGRTGNLLLPWNVEVHCVFASIQHIHCTAHGLRLSFFAVQAPPM